MEEALRTILLANGGVTAIIVDRVWPLEREQGSALPALTYQRVSGVRDHAHSGLTGLVESRFQIDSWAENSGSASGYLTAKGLIQAVVAALGGYRATVGLTDVQGIFIDTERDFPEEAADGKRLARVSLDINVWHTE